MLSAKNVNKYEFGLLLEIHEVKWSASFNIISTLKEN